MIPIAQGFQLVDGLSGRAQCASLIAERSPSLRATFSISAALVASSPCVICPFGLGDGALSREARSDVFTAPLTA